MNDVRQPTTLFQALAIGACVLLVVCAVGLASASPPAAAASTYAGEVLGTPGLQSYWRLDETSGTTAADAEGSNVGTYRGGPTLNRPSLLVNDANPSVGFDGTDDFVDFGDIFGFTGTQPFTVEAWIKPTTVNENDYRYLVSKDAVGTDDGWRFFVVPADHPELPNVLGFERHNSTYPDARAPDVYGSTSIAAGQRIQAVATYDGATMKVYFDGVPDGSTAVDPRPVPTVPTPLTIGASSIGANIFAGDIDDVSIYDRALSASDVAAHHNAGLAIPPPVSPTSPASPAGAGLGSGGVISHSDQSPSDVITHVAQIAAMGLTRFGGQFPAGLGRCLELV